MNKTARSAVVAVGIMLVGTVTGPVWAGGQNGSCESGPEVCFYFNSAGQGSMSDFTNAKANLSGYVFLTSGAGQGQAVKNNSASAKLRSGFGGGACVYYNANFQGASDYIPANAGAVNLQKTYNENASFQYSNGVC